MTISITIVLVFKSYIRGGGGRGAQQQVPFSQKPSKRLSIILQN